MWMNDRARFSVLGIGSLSLALAALAACSSSASAPGVASDVPDAGRDATVDPPIDTGVQGGASLSAWALDFPENFESPTRPVAGARFALDIGDAHRERAAGDDGHVTFEGIDWSLGPATLTAWAAARMIVSIPNITPAALSAYSEVRKSQKIYPQAGGDLAFMLTKLEIPDSVHLVGNVRNKLDAAHWVVWTPSRGHTYMRGHTSDYDILTLKGRPLDLVAWEFAPVADEATHREQQIFRWSELPIPALAADTQKDYDWSAAQALTPQTVHGTIHLPQGAALSAAPQVVATTMEGAPIIGEWVNVSQTTTDTYSFTAEQVAASLGQDHVVSLGIAAMNGGSSTVVKLGALSEGMVFDEFLLPMTVPASVQIGHDLPINGMPANGAVDVAITDPTGDAVWLVTAPFGFPAPTSLIIPSLPAEALAQLPPRIEGSVVLLGPPISGDIPDIARQAAVSRPIVVTR